MMKAIALGLMMAATTAAASDFSALMRPEVVRYYLVPFPREMEKQCAALVLARGARERLLSAAQRTELLDAVVARLAIDVGDLQVVRGALDDQAQALLDRPDDPFAEAQALRVQAVRSQCAPFFAKVAAKGVAAALSPAPTGLVALPDGPTCYAAMKEADRRKLDFNQSDIEPVLHAMLFRDPPPAESAANTIALAKAQAELAAHPPDRGELEVTINFSCMPGIAELALRFPQL